MARSVFERINGGCWLTALMFLVLYGCTEQRGSWAWSCQATHDIRCSDGDCEIAEDPGVVPVAAYFDASGKVSMCAYSGCWEGNGQIQTSRQFHWVLGENLQWDSPNVDDYTDVFVVVDISTSSGVAKANDFAVPVVCGNPRVADVD